MDKNKLRLAESEKGEVIASPEVIAVDDKAASITRIIEQEAVMYPEGGI